MKDWMLRSAPASWLADLEQGNLYYVGYGVPLDGWGIGAGDGTPFPHGSGEGQSNGEVIAEGDGFEDPPWLK